MKHIQVVLLTLAIFFVLAATVLVRQKKEVADTRKNEKRSVALTATPMQESSETEETGKPRTSQTFFVTVASPPDGSAVTSSSVILQGRTLPLAMVVVNETELQANQEGSFSLSVALDEGENIISITAFDQDGNFAEKDITLVYNAPESQ